MDFEEDSYIKSPMSESGCGSGCGSKRTFPSDTNEILSTLYGQGMTGWGRAHSDQIKKLQRQL